MKTRRIAAHRIGTDSKSRKRDSKPTVLAALSIVLACFSLAYALWPSLSAKSTVQVTVTATALPLPTATQLPPTPTALPTPPPVVAPSPTPVAPVFGIVLGDVWLRQAPGGERLPAALLKGQRVEVLESDGDYLKVQWTDGETVLTGWVTAAWVEVLQ